METIDRSDAMVWIGEFFGSIADSPSGGYAIAWGGVAAKSSLEDKHYRLISGNRVLLTGKVNNRILNAKVGDGGHFAVETINPNNNTILLAFNPNGDLLFKKQTDKTFQHFGLSANGSWISWITENRLVVWDVPTSQSLVDVPIPQRMYADDARYTRGADFVEVHQAKLGWYRIALDGIFIDEEAWLNDFVTACDGNTLYHTVKDYYDKISTPTPEDARTYAAWVEEALRRGIKEAFMFTISSVYDYLAVLWTKAGDPVKCEEARAKSEEHLDGFRLVDRAIVQVADIGEPPDQEVARRIVSDLDRATKTPKLLEYPNYVGKLFRTKGEILERLGEVEGAVIAYRKALEGNPKAGCKKHLERLTNSPVVLPEKPKPKPIEERLKLEQLTMFHFRCPVCASTPKEVPLVTYLDMWRIADPQRLRVLLKFLSVASREVRFGKLGARLTKRYQSQADELIRIVTPSGNESGAVHASFLVDVDAKTMAMQTECPVCLHGPGKRTKDNYFTVWPEACGVQSSNLYYEVGVILFGICGAKPPWLTDQLQHYSEQVKSLCFRIGQSIGMSSCPQCGRFTTCLYGGERNNPEKGRCRWCLDTSG